MDELSQSLEKLLFFLKQSQSPIWSNADILEITRAIEAELKRAKLGENVDAQLLKTLLAPTGSIQEISIDNGWGDDFLGIANVIERYL
ncbi:MAG: hypothetical protein ACOYYU_15885 [Chloroflexota bacterium]